MKRKVRITKMPSMANGGVTKTGTQQSYGLYRNERFPIGANSDNDAADDRGIRSYYPESPRDEADIEVEKGELIISGNMTGMYKVGGKKHSEGGTPVKATPGDYIVSDYIQAPAALRDFFGLERTSKKKKDNTWAALLNRKVNAKDYNRLVDILKQASEGKEVDQFELATAKNRVPDYQKYISRAALGNELSKGLEGKPFEIPQIGIPAMQSLVGPSREESEDAPMVEAKYGGALEQYQTRGTVRVPYLPEYSDPMQLTPFVKESFYPWGGDRFENTANASKMSSDEILDKARAIGYRGPNNNLSLQQWILQNHPESKTIIDNLHTQYGVPKAGKSDDGRWGYRWDMVLNTLYKNKKPAEPVSQPVNPSASVTSSTPDNGETTVVKEGDSGQTVRRVDPSFSNQMRKSIRRTPYVQDINNLGDAMSAYYDRADVGPTRVKYNPVYMDPVFVSTESVDNLLAGQFATAAQEAQGYGRNAQGQSAVLSDLQARILPEMIKNRVATNAQNAQSDMIARQNNVQIANQAGVVDAQLNKQFYDENAIFAKNRRDSRGVGRAAVNKALNSVITNSGNTYLLNQRYPQMAFDPMSYDVYFKEDSGKTSGLALDGSGASASYAKVFKENYEALSFIRDEKQRVQAATDATETQLGLNRTRTTSRSYPYNPTNNSVSQTTQGDGLDQGQFGGGVYYPFWQ